MRYWAGLYPGDMQAVVVAGAEAMLGAALKVLGRHSRPAPQLMIMGSAEDEQEDDGEAEALVSRDVEEDPGNDMK
ncbi:hypothetical protein PR202_gb14397 [Eleusine coracana subsp. coracana]|uniref:Uncharacterized protein n=1 Tax=Eleusine coracana subsp. coracana TaxID=191504 RepID=A0AAV5EUZ1_ELECO|nr:hypothetical protein PR202_gb14397 [Eleusine coracana subsp. coracana]